MNKLLTVLLASLFATGAFAAAHMGTTAPATSAANPTPQEAMKSGDAKAQAAGQAKADARAKTGDKKAMQPEAMTAGSDKAQAKAEAKKAKKAKKMTPADEQMKKDATKL
jgi:hypothetical protein